MTVITDKQVTDLFDGTGPDQGYLARIAGGYEEQMKGAGASRVYFPGGSMTLDELNQLSQNTGPSGLIQAGGFQRDQRNQRKQRQKQKQRKTKRRSKSSYRGKSRRMRRRQH